MTVVPCFIEPLPELRRPLFSRYFHLSGAMRYEGKRFSFLVPKEFRTDLGSVPFIVRWLVPRDGKYEAAFILHDYCIDDLRVRLSAGVTIDPRRLEGPLINGRQTDELLRDSLSELDCPFVMRWLIWTGVRWAAPLSRARRSGGIVRDLPLMLLWSMIALPILVLGTVPMLLALAIYGLVELVAWWVGEVTGRRGSSSGC